MRERAGRVLQALGLFVVVPLALYEGFRDGGSVMNELVIAAAGVLMIFVGRGLRAGGPPK